MSNYYNALVESEKFYILPVCNLPINEPVLISEYTDVETWTDWNFNTEGYATGTTGSINFTQYNDHIYNEIIIPQYLKNIGIDYISIASNPFSVNTSAGQDVNTIVFNLVYEILNGINPFIDGNNQSINFEEESKYYNQIKINNGSLLKIDLKNIYSIRDVFTDIQDLLPAPTNSPDKNNKARPYSITFWKKFLNKSESNKNTFIVNNSLPASLNEYYNPYYIP
jgi:hypothetical protein